MRVNGVPNHSKVSFVQSKTKENKVGVLPVYTVSGIGVVTSLGSLSPDEFHHLQYSTHTHIRTHAHAHAHAHSIHTTVTHTNTNTHIYI